MRKINILCIIVMFPSQNNFMFNSVKEAQAIIENCIRQNQQNRQQDIRQNRQQDIRQNRQQDIRQNKQQNKKQIQHCHVSGTADKSSETKPSSMRPNLRLLFLLTVVFISVAIFSIIALFIIQSAIAGF